MIRSLLLSAGGEISEALSDAAMRVALASASGVLWVDLRQCEEDEAAPLLSGVFGFHPLAIDDCFNDRVDTPKIDDYGDYLFLVAQAVSLTRGERLELSEVDIFVGRNYVVTVANRSVATVDEIFERARANTHVMSRGADFLAHSILDSIVDLLLPAVDDIDDALDGLERRILENPQPSLLPELLLLKRNTIRLRRTILPQRDLMNSISRGEYSLIRPEALMFYRDVYDHTVRVGEMLEGVRDVADSALNTYLSAVNNRMNEVMKTLSIVAVVFLPLTLIASVYGTNLDFSPWGLELPGGFFVMLGSMVLLSAGLVFYFRRRKWF